jgi:hypothetical protein
MVQSLTSAKSKFLSLKIFSIHTREGKIIMISHYAKRIFANGCFFILLIVSISARADFGIVPLGTVINQTDHVVVGVVNAVSESKTTGQQVISISVKDMLKGAKLEQFQLVGSTTDPGLPHFNFPKGTKILAFIRRSTESQGFYPVAGQQGVVPFTRGNSDLVLYTVKSVIQNGKNIELKSFTKVLQARQPTLPIVLAGALMSELTKRVTVKDAALLKQIACDTRKTYLKPARSWAIQRSGVLKLGKTRRCLEGLVTAKEEWNSGIQIAAIEALGDLGNPRSTAVLLKLLPELEAKPKKGVAKVSNEDTRLQDESAEREPQGEEPEGGTQQSIKDDEATTSPAKGGERLEPKKAIVSQSNGERTKEQGLKPEGLEIGLIDSVLLALGKIGAPGSISTLQRFALVVPDFSLSSTAVHSLGLTGTPESRQALKTIVQESSNELIRNQASQTLKR